MKGGREEVEEWGVSKRTKTIHFFIKQQPSLVKVRTIGRVEAPSEMEFKEEI